MEPTVTHKSALAITSALFLVVTLVLPLTLVLPAAAQDATPAANGDGAASAATGEFAGLVDIGGRSLYLECTGTGSPTIILEAGNDEGVDGWTLRGDLAAATNTRVCAYDRANIGRSDPVSLPRTGADVVADLHALLDAGDVPGPYVIVSASLGGLFSRLYALTHPDDVAGMVLVDTSYEEGDTRLRALVGPELWATLEEAWGEYRDGEGFFPDGFLSDALVAELRAARQSSPMQPMPLVVVTNRSSWDASAFPEGWPVADNNALWLFLQVEQAAQVPGGRVLISEANDHYLQQADPELVIDAVSQVVEGVRDPSTWETPSAATPVP
jgi:pimeloyl-ACP methyl ester carboxylesterase